MFQQKGGQIYDFKKYSNGPINKSNIQQLFFLTTKDKFFTAWRMMAQSSRQTVGGSNLLILASTSEANLRPKNMIDENCDYG